MRIEINDPKNFEITAKRIGEDRNPLIIVDNFLANADQVREFALECQFLSSNEYPGYVCPNMLLGMNDVLAWMSAYLVEECYGSNPLLNAQIEPAGRSRFSLFAPDLEKKLENVHVDPNNFIGALLYLSDSENTGTALWRDKVTGLQSFISTSVVAIQKMEEIFGLQILEKLKKSFLRTPVLSLRQVQKILFEDRAIDPSRLPGTDYGDWELLDRVETKFNRLVFYPAWQIHSVYYEHYQPPTSVRDGRLSLNIQLAWPFYPDAPSMAAPIKGLELMRQYVYA